MPTAAAPKRLEASLDALAKPFVFVTGKGGVGKTTVSSALALLLSERGQRVLLATSEPKERLSHLLGAPRIGEQIEQIQPNLWAVNINPRAAVREYGGLILKAGVLQRAVFDNNRVQQFLAAVPGLHQWAILGKAWYHSTELTKAGEPRFHHVIFDAPATGHALEMLWVPKIVSQIGRAGALLRDADSAWAMLHDAKHTALLLVAQAEQGPATEALELATRLEQELGLVPAAGLVNLLTPLLLGAAERAALNALAPERVNEPLRSSIQALAFRAAVETTQEESLHTLYQALHIPWLTLPRLDIDASSALATRKLARLLARALTQPNSTGSVAPLGR